MKLLGLGLDLSNIYFCGVVIKDFCKSDVLIKSVFGPYNFRVLSLVSTESMSIYDDIDADVLQNYQEYSLANIIYYSLKESTTSEQSARMTAMDNASKNACEHSRCPRAVSARRPHARAGPFFQGPGSRRARTESCALHWFWGIFDQISLLEFSHLRR